MSEHLTQDIGRILLAGLVVFTVLGVLRDAGLTGFSVASLELPIYVGPEKVYAKQDTMLTLDLNYYFTGHDDIVYTVTSQNGVNAQLHNNILVIIPETNFAGESEITIYASNKEQITKQKLIINIEPKPAPAKKCGCGG